MRKFSRKSKNKSKKHTKKNGRRYRRRHIRMSHMRGGCGGGTCQPMIGGEDPQLSTDIYNYNISDLPHRVSA